MTTLDEAKDLIKATPISSIIGYYHPITKKGANFEGICPFHSDDHPSLKINDSKGIYKCFACGAAGDALKFVQDKLNLSFVEAIKNIASTMGVEIEENSKKRKDPKQELGLRVLKGANRIYQKTATDYAPKEFASFLKKRGINQDSCKKFELGFASKNNVLLHYLQDLADDLSPRAIKVAQEIGIIRQGQNGPYDFFRDRITFPIWDQSGTVRGFSTRAIRENQNPKYLNSGESSLFHKGRILYGLHLAKKAIRSKQRVFIVEGNMDVLMLHQYGFEESVALMGIALSDYGLSILKNLTKNIFLAMDNDNAGLAAMLKINGMWMKEGLFPRYISYAPHKDADDFLNAEGRLALQKRIDEAPLFLDFYLEKHLLAEIPKATEQKLHQLNEIFEFIAPLGDDLMAKEKVISASKALGLRASNEDLVQSYKNFLQQAPKNIGHGHTPQPVSSLSSAPEIQSEQVSPVVAPQSTAPKIELKTLEIVASHPDIMTQDIFPDLLDLIGHYEVKQLVQWLQSMFMELDDKEYLNILQQAINAQEYSAVVKDAIYRGLYNFEDNIKDKKIMNKMAQDLTWQLKKAKLKQEKQDLLVAKSNCLYEEEHLEIIAKIQKIDKEINQLHQR